MHHNSVVADERSRSRGTLIQRTRQVCRYPAPKSTTDGVLAGRRRLCVLRDVCKVSLENIILPEARKIV
jgi:hypothetical protein